MEKLHYTRDSFIPLVIASVTLPLIINIWLSAVSNGVSEPYLDEVFHVRQAQTYCAGRLHEWDPKITTPPGLYLISYLVYQATGHCGLSALRILSGAFLFSIFLVLLYMRCPSKSRASYHASQITSVLPNIADASPQHIHTAFNICLFPPLFFFCGLYYTDVASTLFVLLFFKHFYDIHSRPGSPTIFQSVVSIFLGSLSLTFRQTNIFWVAVFPAGFVVLGAIAERREQARPVSSRSSTLQSRLRSFIEQSWQSGVLYDPQIRGAWIEDYFFIVVSIFTLVARTLTAPYKLLRLVRLVSPYAILLALFGGFVIWNGGVVLGDKSNHVATLHLPQMLYIWPYVTFFSIPLTYPFFLQGVLALLALIPVVVVFEPLLIFSRQKILPRPLVVFLCVGLAMLVVNVNTIVHPFTLADNRHYTFYVFRILMRNRITKYLAAPIYLICAWSAVQALGASGSFFFTDRDSAVEAAMENSGVETKVVASHASKQIVRLNNASFGEGSTASFLLIWLITSALTLVTAPLVEPRYFIIPWVMWRLRVPQAHPGVCEPHPYQVLAAHLRNENTTAKRVGDTLKRVLWLEHDPRLWLETAWYLLINAVTGWVFLNKGFTWPQEPGNVQRFMW